MKTGFETYSKSFELSSSRSIAVTMSSGVALVTGFVFGSTRTWVGTSPKTSVSAITGAAMSFIPVDGVSDDTLTALSDPQYGDLRISLPKNRKYQVRCSAEGFAAKLSADTLVTKADTSIQRADTLYAFGMATGTVVSSVGGQPLKNVSVSLVTVPGAVQVASAKSQADGHFELKGVLDGKYLVRAGREGVVFDSAVANGASRLKSDTVTFTKGLCLNGVLSVYMSPGTKNIAWNLESGGKAIAASIKVLSPLQKTLASYLDTLKNVGAGQFVVTVDAADRSYLDLSYHAFAVFDTEVVHRERLSLPVRHVADTMPVVTNDSVTLVLTSDTNLDSAVISFKDVTERSYVSTRKVGSSKEFSFTVKPTKDASTMQYYFVAYRGSDVYGYDKEVYTAFIKPSRGTLAKYEVAPGSDDTLLYPSSYTVTFTFKGYYSSMFLLDTLVDAKSVSWKLLNEQGCAMGKSDGLSVQVKTGGVKTGTPVMLQVHVNTAITRLASGVPDTDTLFFVVSGSKLDSIYVERVGADEPISNTASASAHFAAWGLDDSGAVLALTPEWRLEPQMAGAVSVDGIFTPARRFVGSVRVLAQAGGLGAEFKPRIAGRKDEPGLMVHHLIRLSSEPDTAENGRGCTLFFPDSVVAGRDVGRLEVKVPELDNAVMKGMDDVFVVGDVYDVNETQGITLTPHGSDSIRLVLDVPAVMQSKVKANPSRFLMAVWNPDSVRWDALSNSSVAADGRSVAVNITHFSSYAIVGRGGQLSAELMVSPNPFSPYVQPRGASKSGTCIEFTLDADQLKLAYAWVRIYNMLGDLVYSVKVTDPTKGTPYTLWWDGKTTKEEQSLSGGRSELNPQSEIRTSRMCRNGRYFLVLSVKDSHNREKHYTKPLVMLK